jgi:hypothetical protein
MHRYRYTLKTLTGDDMGRGKSKKPPHPCLECGEITTRPKFCCRTCGVRYWQRRRRRSNRIVTKYTSGVKLESIRCKDDIDSIKHLAADMIIQAFADLKLERYRDFAIRFFQDLREERSFCVDVLNINMEIILHKADELVRLTGENGSLIKPDFPHRKRPKVRQRSDRDAVLQAHSMG